MINFIKLFFLFIFLNTCTLTSNNITDGKIQFFYGTDDSENIFNKKSSDIDVNFNIHNKYHLNNVLISRVGFSLVSSLGLNNILADKSWIEHDKDILWLDIANIEYSIFKESSIIFGRQTLNTPLIRSEKWNISTNTFDAIKLNINNIKYFNTKFIVITRGNASVKKTVKPENLFQAGMMGFGSNNDKLIFIAGINSDAFKYTVIDVWYYRMPDKFHAYWIEAVRKQNDLELGIQVSQLYPEDNKNILGVAIKICFNINDAVSILAAYSTVNNDDSQYNISNLAGDNKGGAVSNFYTEAFWNYGYTGREGSQSYKLEMDISFRVFELKGGFVNSQGVDNDSDLNELYIESTIEYDIFDIKLSFINSQIGDADRVNRFMAQFSIPFNL